MELEIGKRITSLRKIKGITQLQLANYLGVLPQTVSRWETENGIPDVYLLPKIANFFNQKPPFGKSQDFYMSSAVISVRSATTITKTAAPREAIGTSVLN